ncbi:heterogeneous nuclear ribonucleoprotein R-like isoform X1 [Asparagus officinalis]|uniref:heterogeneous nuclear ribonucleoprotein R-like isoform X1 n=2 Tax=Asparagus officinalis TaxID=4686 RepID=UPI00098E3659|nr:heterogeneous nuclear ribonucleoprotein R-like isoform X1 [Asparagus officinalis]XP_020241200.1 heterogeneous nuclear ribonucleoprotein R-like isoform X1 [Asparagus officinalis]XP_020241201.1 heterogeneous nuclear ribonucleoprotein R-like isoform X1 [Asparagus officinalis]
MPRTRRNAAVAKAAEPVEPVEPIEPEEQVNLEENEEAMEEEVEYEEVEEEVEEEEEEEVIEEEEDDEEDEEETIAANDGDAEATTGSDSMKVDEEDDRDDDEIKEHAELLARPPHGSEVYVGGLPSDATEEDLKGFCESVGEVAEVRMMKGKDSSENKGFAFVTFRTKELAAKAIKDLNNTELKGKKIKCSTSQAKHRLFIGNVPRNWLQDDLRKAVTKVGPGVVTVDLMMDPQNSSRNRGFAFVEYYNHACAEYSKKKMSSAKFKLDNNAPTVSWADPKSGDSSSNSQIKAVYVKNLPKDVTQDQLRKLFEHHGEITKVVLPPAKSGQEKRFGFVHFAERSTAMKALKNTEKYELRGDVLECSLAKPPSDKKVDTGSNAHKGALLPNFAPRGYGVMGGTFGGLAPGFAPPMMYGRGQTPGGMAMVPMILPDGRVGYVLQQPGAPMPQQQRGGGRGGSSSSGGRKGNDNSRGRRFQPY